jgi:molybdopterin synthase catalytic subunit
VSIALTAEPLSMEQAATWVTRPDCGAVVVFGGTVRDHAEGRPGVTELEYEAYAAQVEPRLVAIAAQARAHWPGVGRLVLWHRVGKLMVTECSVVVAASAGHRGDAFDAARFCIDTLKRTVPIWKRERWAGGEDWGQDAHDIAEIGDITELSK